MSGVTELVRRPPGQVPVLDALRSLAVLLVVVGHFAADVASDTRLLGGSTFFQALPFRFGWTGVDLFFVLSGYLIGGQLWRELVRTARVDVPRFVLRRGFRIWPLYVLFIAVTCVTPPHVPSLPDVLFYSNYAPGYIPGGWSLSTEEQFYIVIPTAVLALRSRSARVWVALIPALMGGVILARVVTARALLGHGMTLTAVKNAMYFPFHLRSEALLVGLLIALWSVLRPAWFIRSRADGFSWKGFSVAVGGLILGGALRSASNVVFPFTGLALIFGGCVVWLLLDRSWVSRTLGGKAFYLLSRLSYGTYLNHLYLMSFVSSWVMAALARRLGPGIVVGLVGLTLTLVLSLAVAAVTFVLVEHPFLRMRARLMHPRAP